jgi:hypothetical protein
LNCSIEVPAPDAGFSVTFASPKFQPVTVPVQVIRNLGDFASPPRTIIEPSPGVRGTQAGHAAAEGAQADAAEEAEAGAGGRVGRVEPGPRPGETRHALNPAAPCSGRLRIVDALEGA